MQSWFTGFSHLQPVFQSIAYMEVDVKDSCSLSCSGIRSDNFDVHSCRKGNE